MIKNISAKTESGFRLIFRLIFFNTENCRTDFLVGSSFNVLKYLIFLRFSKFSLHLARNKLESLFYNNNLILEPVLFDSESLQNIRVNVLYVHSEICV